MRNQVKKTLSAVTALTMLSVCCGNITTIVSYADDEASNVDTSSVADVVTDCPAFDEVVNILDNRITYEEFLNNAIADKTALSDNNAVSFASNWERVVTNGLCRKEFTPISDESTGNVKALEFYCIGEQHPSYLVNGGSVWYVFDSYGVTVFKLQDLESIITPDDYKFSNFNTSNFINLIPKDGIKSDINCIIYTGDITSEMFDVYYTYVKAAGDLCNTSNLYACSRNGLLNAEASNTFSRLDYCELIAEDIAGTLDIRSQHVRVIGNLINSNDTKDGTARLIFSDVIDAEHSGVELTDIEEQKNYNKIYLNSNQSPVTLNKYNSLGSTVYVFESLGADVNLLFGIDESLNKFDGVVDSYVFRETGVNSDELLLNSDSKFRFTFTNRYKPENNSVYITNDDFIVPHTLNPRTNEQANCTYYDAFVGRTVINNAMRRSGMILPKLSGDANADGTVDIRDVTAIARHIVKLDNLAGEKSDNADTIRDGYVDIKDLGQLKKFLIKEVDMESFCQTPLLFTSEFVD